MKKISKSLEDYLEAILIFELKNKPIHSVKIANFLNVSKPAVSKAMQELINLGYIEKKSYGTIILQPAGRLIAQNVYEKHLAIESFLINLGVSKKTAEEDCCLIEHCISEETLNCIKRFNENYNKNKEN